MQTLFDDLPTFSDVEGNDFYLVDYLKPNKLKVWDKERPLNGEYITTCRLIDIAQVDKEELAKLSIWKEMPQEIQDEMKTAKEIERIQVHSLMEKARSGRKERYPNVPREIICTSCSKVIKVQPGTLMKKLDHKRIALGDYLKSFKCPKCNGGKGRGRAPNPEFANLPEEMVCKCGNRVHINATYLKAKAAKKKTTIEELVKNFVCQKCCNTKGRPKGKKK